MVTELAKWTLQVVRFVDADMVARVLEVEHRIGETIPVTVAGVRMTCPAPHHWEVGDLITIPLADDHIEGNLRYPGFGDFARHLQVGDRLTVATAEPAPLEVTHVGA